MAVAAHFGFDTTYTSGKATDGRLEDCAVAGRRCRVVPVGDPRRSGEVAASQACEVDDYAELGRAVTGIERESAVAGQPYANLIPMVDLLVRLGNVTVNGGFIINPDGWRCRLRHPTDFEAVRREFEVPASIHLSDVHDTILDTLSWISIEGPGAAFIHKDVRGMLDSD